MNSEIPVKEIMTKNVIVVETDDVLSKVEEILDSNPIHHIVVIDQGQVVGIISKTDLIKAYRNMGIEVHEKMRALRVSDIMVANPLVVDPDDSIGLVSDIILANKFHSLPVVDDGELVGIVTNHDLIKYSYK